MFRPLAASPSQLDQISCSPRPNPPSRQAPMFERLFIGHGGIVGYRGAPPISYMSHRRRSGPCFVTATPLSSNVAGTAAFSPLVRLQRPFNRHGVFNGRHVTIVEEEGARPATRDLVTVLQVPQAREGVGRGDDEEVSYRGQDARSPPSHEPPATDSGRAGDASYDSRQSTARPTVGSIGRGRVE
jgi:hypothetical protein